MTYGGKTPPKRPVQEEDVDALTNLLVQSMDSAADPEFFGKILIVYERDVSNRAVTGN